jgi:asparagine synthase (glutamine-hydrolysing)|tara:strand:- start:345 stop:2207 length:1863 start_codon:yes stop_codon:yes gene_type:complete
MCGIFIAIKKSDKGILSYNHCKRATECTNHRGPDNIGFFNDDLCFMGHNRLSILGLENNSNQPFEFDKYIIVYNGEIFNYIEIKDSLVKKGYAFSTSSDTEVLLKAYIEWGVNAFDKFNGMWALAIYNKESNELIVSRDRFGQKPLFISEKNDCLYFFSEPQQFHQIQKTKPNYDLIRRFIREGNYNKNDRKTFFSNVEEFPKAYNLILKYNHDIKIERYWSYPKSIERKNSNESFQEFNDLLKDAVKLRLRADVDVGLLVSGGVDSTIIASLVREESEKDKKIFAYSYSSDDKYDESSFAKIVSKKLKLHISFLKQDYNSKNYISRLKAIVKNLGRGHSSPAIISIDYLYEEARKDKLKVILDGQGADELLAGYKQYFIHIIFEQLSKFHFKQAYFNLKVMMKVGKQHDYGGVYGSLMVFILFIRENLPDFFKKMMRTIYGYEKVISSTKIVKEYSIIDVKDERNTNNNLVNRHLIHQHNNGLENLLYYGDIVAMKNSVENRSPFMDHRLIEFAFKSDEYLKVYNGIEKYALKRNEHYNKFSDILNRDKIGFSSDIRYETKEAMIEELTNSPIIDWPIFKKKDIKNWILSREALLSKYERFLFRIFQVHLWNQIFIEDS